MNKIASTSSAVVVKYGGSALHIAGPDPVIDEIAELHRQGRAVVIVHGGGPEIDRALARRRIATRRVDGLRVTGRATLEVTEAVLCSTVNKRIVRALLHAQVAAAGISGQDGATLVADKFSASSDLGYVGTIVQTNPQLLEALLANGFVPVVSPLAISRDATHAFNVNADSAAAAIAVGIRAAALVLLTDVARVLRDPKDPQSAIDRMSPADAAEFADSPACRDGMRPKIQAAATYLSASLGRAYICSSKTNAIAAAFAGDATILEDA